MRITQRYLKEWLQKEFQRLNIELIVQDIYKTRCSQNQYECGAAYYILKVGDTEKSTWTQTVYIFYPLWYLQKELNNGYELYWKPHEGRYIHESEIDIRKKQK